MYKNALNKYSSSNVQIFLVMLSMRSEAISFGCGCPALTVILSAVEGSSEAKTPSKRYSGIVAGLFVLAILVACIDCAVAEQ